MLVDYEYRSGNLIVSYIDKTGQIKLKYKNWSRPTKFIKTGDDDPEKSGRFVTWDGSSVKEIYSKYPNKYSVYDFIDNLPKEERDEIYGYSEADIYFIDIENQILDKKPEPHLAESEIQTISVVNKNKILVIGTESLNSSQIESIESDVNNHFKKFETKYVFKYIQYKNEYDLLFNFFNKLIPKMPVITGWNVIQYDWVFLVNRARKIGVNPDVASFTKKLTQPFNMGKNVMGKIDYAEMPAHRVIVDYMELFKKWDTSVKVKESLSLDFVSEKVLGKDVKKINYEGDLTRLHREDYKKFVFYNAVDSCLVQRIHVKMKYVDILYGMSVLGKIRIKDAFSTLALTEGILREKLRDQKNIVLVRDEHVDEFGDTDAAAIKGGWVKEPVRGMATWTTCYDFASLYPTSMREFNISADSYKGQQVKGKDYSIFNGHQLMIDSTDIVTLNGSVFKNEVGVVTSVMGEIYGDRKRWKKTMMEKHTELEKLKAELKNLEDTTL